MLQQQWALALKLTTTQQNNKKPPNWWFFCALFVGKKSISIFSSYKIIKTITFYY